VEKILQQAVLLTPEEQLTLFKGNNITITDILSIVKSENVELREQYAPRVLMDLVNARLVDHQELKEIVQRLVSATYLYEGIGEQHTKTVFIRSTSAMWLTILIQADMEQHFLTTEEAKDVLQQLSVYLLKERDVRGYVEGQGWANAATNAMNLYLTCLQHPAFEIRFVPNILSGISKALITGYVFVDDEEARFAQFVQALSNLDYPEEVLIEWIEQLYDKLQYHLYEEGYTSAYYKNKTNLTHLMQSLYFKLKFSNTYPKTQGVVSIFLSKWVS
jgi:hypothetical protein